MNREAFSFPYYTIISMQLYQTKNDSRSNQNQTEVIAIVRRKFMDLFNTVPMIVSSPGRINLIGEHTDYNCGYAMPAAIDKGVQIALAPAANGQSFIYSIKYDEFFTIDFSDLETVKFHRWASYFVGILYRLNARGLKIRNFNCVFDGDLPPGRRTIFFCGIGVWFCICAQ